MIHSLFYLYDCEVGYGSSLIWIHECESLLSDIEIELPV